MKKIRLLTNVLLTNVFPDSLDIRVLSAETSSSRLIRVLSLVWAFARSDVVLILNADAVHALAALLGKALTFGRVKVAFFDTLLALPSTRTDRVALKFRRLLFGAVDAFLAVHRDIGRYSEIFGIPESRFRYIPFKANNYEVLDQFSIADDGYIFSGGASYRDFQCLVEAASRLDYPVKIVLPASDVAAYHNTRDLNESVPGNVEIVRHDGNKQTWNEYIARSTFVVVPIRADCIQPAGISVYLEAMALGKAVVISKGASTNDLLNEGLAGIYLPGDSSALETVIRSFLRDRDERERVAENGRLYALSLAGEKRLSRDLQQAALDLHHRSSTQ